jgi:hypothetical protein
MRKSFDILIAQRRLAEAFATARMLRRLYAGDQARRVFADDYTDQARRWMRVVVAARRGNARA